MVVARLRCYFTCIRGMFTHVWLNPAEYSKTKNGQSDLDNAL